MLLLIASSGFYESTITIRERVRKRDLNAVTFTRQNDKMGACFNNANVMARELMCGNVRCRFTPKFEHRISFILFH